MLNIIRATSKKWISCFCYFTLFAILSADAQTLWFKDTNNPVLQRDTVLANLPNDLIAISDPWVIKEGTTFKMWYTCGGINYPADTLLRSRICYATSSNGIDWDKYENNPVMDIDYDGNWDSLGVETVSIIIDEDASPAERYKMWYAGQYINDYRYDIGYSVSGDGITWTKYNDPVLMTGNIDEWDNGFLEGPSVIKDGDMYKMWYCGYDAIVDGNSTDGKANIGYAFSDDGINWTKYADNPIIVTGENTWDSIYVQDPHVIKNGDIYQMWFGGGDNDTYYSQQVGYAFSTDGINWTKSPLNPVLERGNDGDWDKILASFPSVLIDNEGYKMWYTGRNLDPLIENSLDYYWEVGFATAPFTTVYNLANVEQLIIFPNPAKNEIVLHVNEIYLNADLTIYNHQGQVIFKNTMHITDNYPINIQGFSEGIYYLYLQAGDSHTKQKFIVVN